MVGIMHLCKQRTVAIGCVYKFHSHGESGSVDFQRVLVGNPIDGFPHFPFIQGKPVTHCALVITEAASDFLHQSISCTRF